MDNPNLIERIQLTWRFWKEATRFMVPRQSASHAPMSVPTWPGETKKAPFIWPEWRMGKPQWQIINFEGYAQEGFCENAVVYAAIMFKVEAITIAPLRAYTGSFEEPELLPAEHPLQRLVSRPNRYMSWSEFQGLAEIYLNLAGNVYIYVEREKEDDPIPKALWLLRPDRTYIVPHPKWREKSLKGHPMWKPDDDKEKEIKASTVAGERKLEGKAEDSDEKLVGFYYVPEGRSQADGIGFLPKDIIHIKLPSPLDPLDGLGYGLSPVSPMARSADVDNQVTKYLKLFFEKGAMPPGLLSFDVPMTDANVARARERWMEIYGSVEEMHKVAVLDQGGEYQRLGLGFGEMGFEVIDERNESRICGPFGVPPILIGTRIGLPGASYGKAYEEARKAFWEDRMTPELRWFEVEYQFYLQGDKGEFVMFDLSKVPALTPTPQQKVEWGAEAFARMGISRNEYRAILGLDPTEGEDVYVGPMTLIQVPVKGIEEEKPPPSDEETQEGMPDATEEEDKASKQGSMSDGQKAVFWKATDLQARSWENRFGEAAEEAFRNDLREILALIGKGKAKSLEDKATVAWSLVLLAVTDYLAMAGQENWREVFSPVLSGLILERGEQLNLEFGMTFDVRNLLAEKWFEDYTLTFAQPINATTEETMRLMFNQAMSEGWSVPMMQKNLETMFKQWMTGDVSPDDMAWYEERMPPHRREMIARTETIRASNAGSEALYRNWGVQLKEWYSTPDSRTRVDHQIGAAWGDPPLVVPINQPFDVGGESLMYPGDPSGSPANTVNCRCTVLPVI